MPHHNPNLRFSGRRYFAPICIRHKHGYYGGPAGYREMSLMEAKVRSPIILKGVVKNVR